MDGKTSDVTFVFGKGQRFGVPQGLRVRVASCGLPDLKESGQKE